jgi:hypothetical protein
MRVAAWWIVLLLAGLAGGCGTPSQSLQMRLSPADTLQLRGWMPDPLRGQVALADVTGGNETGLWWGSKVSSLALEHALEDSLRGVGLWAMDPKQARYQLTAQLLSLSQPLVALDTQVVAVVDYRLLDRSSGALVYQRSVRSTHTTEFTEALISQPERLRLASEGAVRNTVNTMLRDLPTLRF